jgi:hypothetical protein
MMLEAVERYVADELFAKLEAQPEFAVALAADQHAERRAELARDLRRIQADRVTEARRKARREVTEGEWLAMREEYDKQEADAQRELREIPQPVTTPGGVDWAVMRELWDDPAAELDERRAFLRRYIVRVTVDRARRGTRVFDSGRVTITYRKV